MITYKFDNSKKLFSFINSCEEIKNFPIKEMKLYSVDGENMGYNIEFNDRNKKEELLKTMKNKEIEEKFNRTMQDVINGVQRGLIFDMWIMIPSEMKGTSFDLSIEYDELYFHIYDDDDVINISTHFKEKKRTAGIGAIKRLDNYLAELYAGWYSSLYVQK